MRGSSSQSLLQLHCLPRGQYNESGHPPLTFSIARCPRLTALYALTSGCANLPYDNIHECTTWVRGIIKWVNVNIKCVAQALSVSLVRLDSTLTFFLMASAITFLFSVAQRSNTLRYLPVEGIARRSCSHPYCSCLSKPQPHVFCFYEHVSPSRVVDAWDVAHECTILKCLHHHRIPASSWVERRSCRSILRPPAERK